ncbi:MAG: LemA family protein [Fusobacteria bacterium]|nr:LemA family protein [Fusobacteriota bacterium]
MTKWIIIIIVIVIIVFVIATYNTLIRMIETIKNNEKQIDIQLDRRYKVFENLISVVKKYMDYEQSTLKDVVKLRNQAQSAQASGDSETRMEAENQISKLLGGINLVFEQYPDLKANQNALQLQEEIVSTENKLAFAKQAFNDSVQSYTQTKKSFFQQIVVGIFKSLNQNFSYWSLDVEDKKAKEAYQVKF